MEMQSYPTFSGNNDTSPDSTSSPVYDEPYAHVASADPGGFVALGGTSIKVYTKVDVDDGNAIYSKYGLPGAIGNASFRTYQDVD